MVLGLIFTRKIRKKRKLKAGWYWMFVGTLVLFLLSTRLVANLLVYSLEGKYQPPSSEVLSALDVIVILNGGIYPSGGFLKYPEVSEVTCSRLCSGIRIFKQSSAHILVLSGAGSPSNSKLDSKKDAEVMRNFAVRLGVPEDKIITETKSRNTMEHAVELAKLLYSTANKRIGIVTSALHMLRSEKAFKRKFSDDNIVPIPVNYIYSSLEYNIGTFLPSSDAFSMSSRAIHEWLGIAWYSVRY